MRSSSSAAAPAAKIIPRVYDLCVLVPDNRRFAREAPFWLWNSVNLGVPVDIA